MANFRRVYAQFDEAFDDAQFDEIMPSLTNLQIRFIFGIFLVWFFLGVFLGKH